MLGFIIFLIILGLISLNQIYKKIEEIEKKKKQ
jgi:hypothetical protein